MLSLCSPHPHPKRLRHRRHPALALFVAVHARMPNARRGNNTMRRYRHYATLYFVFAVDHSESQLGILDLIQVFVESLDNCFKNVCELDIIFNSEVG